MLTSRQKCILTDLYENGDGFLSAAFLAKKHGVSVATIKKDISLIKNELKNSKGHILSSPAKGYRLIIEDSSTFRRFLDTCTCETVSYNEQASRILYIMSELLNGSKFTRSTDLADALYLSSSRLTDDLRIVRKKLAEYHIDVKSKPGYGLYIVGEESCIRRCIIKENINNYQISNRSLMHDDREDRMMTDIRNLLTDVFISSHFIITDVVFQNLVVHVVTSIKRMENNHYNTACTDLPDDSYSHVKIIADEIMEKVCAKYQLRFSQTESNLLAMNIQGKREISSESYISDELNRFIYQNLIAIREQFGVNLTDDMNLRISLALHTYPLIARIRSGMQLKNSMAYQIKQNFILSFDIASAFSYELYKKYGVKIIDDEISFLALHFESAIKSRKNEDTHKILLISSEKKSYTILIRQKLLSWFQNKIEIIDIMNPSSITMETHKRYDIVLATEDETAKKHNAIRINFFPTDQDFGKISLAMDGYRTPQDILDKFDRNLFVQVDSVTKTEAIKLLCDKACSMSFADCSLYEEIMKHEAVANTYFGHSLAVPHPENLVTDTNFVAVLCSKKPIDWEDGKSVRLVFLVSIERNNPKAYSLWGYLSTLISNKEVIDQIIKSSDYDAMLSILFDLYAPIFEDN